MKPRLPRLYVASARHVTCLMTTRTSRRTCLRREAAAQMRAYVIERMSPRDGRPEWFGGYGDVGDPLWIEESDEAQPFGTRTRAELTLDSLRRAAPAAARLRVVEVIS